MQPGQQLGKFLLESLVGTGGFGDVWKARDPSLGRLVALKLLRQDDPENAARFLREAQAAAALAHPNIVRVYESGTIGDQPFIAMEFIDGPTLATARGATRETVERIRDAARALHYAHERGIVHRDVKPENLMLEGSRVLVMDFGLARTVHASGLTAAGMAIGTPNFMSPEQARGDLAAIDPRSDVYSLGATLFALLAARPPFEATTLLDILTMIVNDEPPLLRSLLPALDADLETIVHKCLEKEPSRRYPSAEALAADLDRYLRADPIEARASTVLYRLGKSLKRRRGVTLAALGGLSAVLAILLVLVPALRRTEGGLTAAQQQLVDQMRRASDVSLNAVLDLRRSGSLAKMREQGAELDALCRRVSMEMPRLAEPHVRRGRLYRAQLRWSDAIASQDAALKVDPGDRTARFERGLLHYRAYVDHLTTLLSEWRRDQAIALLQDRLRLDQPPVRQLEDDRARFLRRNIEQDFRNLDDAVAIVLLDWLAGGSTWRTRLPDVVREQPDREEAVEVLGRLYSDSGALDDADELYRRGIERDRGYLPFYLARARIFSGRANSLAEGVGDPVPSFRAAVETLDQAAVLGPNEPPILFERGSVYAAWAIFAARGDGDVASLHRHALRDFEHTCALTPTLTAPLIALAGVLQLFASDEFQAGRDPAPYLDVAERRLIQARAIDDSPAVQGRAGYVLTIKAWIRYQQGEDTSALLDAGMALIDVAARAAPEAFQIWQRRAINRHYRAIVAESRGRDPLEFLVAARESLDKALLLDPSSPIALSVKAVTEADIAAWDALQGRPCDDRFESAIRQHDVAVDKGRERATPVAERARTYLRWAVSRISRGLDVGDRLDRADADFTEAIRIAPRASRHWANRGEGATLRALQIAISGRDPTTLLQSAIADLERAIALCPRDEEAFWFRAGARVNLGYWTALRGGDPQAHYLAAEADYDQSLAFNPSRDEVWLRRGQHWVNRGLHLRSRNQDPEPLYKRAAADYERARSINAVRVETWLSEAQLGMNWGSLNASRNIDPRDQYERALSAIDRAILLNGSVDLQHVRRGQILVNRALWTARSGDPTPDFEEALKAYATALTLNDRRDETWLSRAHVRALAYSREGAQTPALEREILDDFAQAATLNPSNSEARWRRAQFHMSRSRWREALDDFAAATKLNPALEPRFARAVEECKRRLAE